MKTMTARWIVCESSSRWTAALRVALARHSARDLCEPQLAQVRNLPELTAGLTERPDSLALVEVTFKNFESILTWLATTLRANAHFKAVALLDRDFSDPDYLPRNTKGLSLGEVTAALREAGAAEVVGSPRHLLPVLSLGLQIASNKQTDHAPAAAEPVENWAFGLLPWQDAPRQLG